MSLKSAYIKPKIDIVDDKTFHLNICWCWDNLKVTKYIMKHVEFVEGTKVFICGHIDILSAPFYKALAERGIHIFLTLCHPRLKVDSKIVSFLKYTAFLLFMHSLFNLN